MHQGSICKRPASAQAASRRVHQAPVCPSLPHACPTQVVPGVMWTFEQEQSFAFTNVATVVRMTVIKLQSGGLWVYAPIAPTRCARCTGYAALPRPRREQ